MTASITYTSARRYKPDVVGAELAPSMTYTNWTAGNSATLSNDSDGNLKILYNAVAYPYAYKQITGLTSGAIYRVRISSASDGTASDSTVGVGATSTTGDLAYSDTRGTTAAQDYEFYVRTTTTSLYIVLNHLHASSGYSLFSSVSVRQVTTLTHDIINVLYDGAQWGMYTAVNSTLDPTMDIWGISGIASGQDGDNALKVINTGAAYGRANRTYAFPTVAGRQYKASALWIPHSVATGSVEIGTALGGAQIGSASLYSDIDSANPFFTAGTDSSGNALRWNFTNTDDGWTFTNITDANSATYVGCTSTTTAPRMRITGLSFSGYENRYVCVWMRRTSASWSDDPYLYYTTASHGQSVSYYASRGGTAAPVQVASGSGARTMLVWDMWQLTAGGTDWKDNTITGLGIPFTTTSGATWEVDLIAVGNLNPLELTFTATGSSTYLSFYNSNETDALSYYILPHVDQQDSEYTLSPEFSRADQSYPEAVNRQISLNGTTETIFSREDEIWSVTTDILTSNDELADYLEFTSSCKAGETFTIDLYGDGNEVTAKLEPGSVSIDRVSNGYKYRVSFSYRVVS